MGTVMTMVFDELDPLLLSDFEDGVVDIGKPVVFEENNLVMVVAGFVV